MVFIDRSLGRLHRQPGVQIGDFVVRRKDGQVSYQLACAVDEVALGISEIVRGRDLVASTFRQRWVLQALQHPTPQYRHLPLVIDADGRKLSKRDGDTALHSDQAAAQLLAVLQALGQALPPAPERGSPQAILRAAARRWRPEQIPTGVVRIL
jgi:glutamyl-Q tRNA(Asp) synthetase